MPLIEQGLRRVDIVGWEPLLISDAVVAFQTVVASLQPGTTFDQIRRIVSGLEKGVIKDSRYPYLENALSLNRWIKGQEPASFRIAPVTEILVPYQRESHIVNLLISRLGTSLYSHSLSEHGIEPIRNAAQYIESLCTFLAKPTSLEVGSQDNH